MRNIPKRDKTGNCYIIKHAELNTIVRHASKYNETLLTDGFKGHIESLLNHEKWNPEFILAKLNL